MAEVLICSAGTCAKPAQPEHTPCCSSHDRALCCAHYRHTHFVEVSECSPFTHPSTRKAS